WPRDWSSDVCSSDLVAAVFRATRRRGVQFWPLGAKYSAQSWLFFALDCVCAVAGREISPRGERTRSPLGTQVRHGESVLWRTTRSEEHTSELQSRGH